MARPGITFDDVRHAALQLVRDNETPSIQRLREVLGRGSNTTIASHLRRWQSELARHQVAELPLAVPPQLLSAVEQFWLAALDQANAVFQDRRQSLEDAAAQAVQARDVALAGRLEAERRLDDQEQALERLRAECRQLSHQHQKAQTEHDSLTRLLHSREADWARLSRETQARIDALEAALAQTRREAREDVDRERELTKALDDARERIQASEQQAATLRGRLDEQTPQLAILSQQVADLSARIDLETASRHQAEQRASVAEERAAALRHELNWTRIQLESLESDKR